MSVYECPMSKEAFLRSLPSLRVSSVVLSRARLSWLKVMDTLYDQFPHPDPGCTSEDSNMVENLELECDTFFIMNKSGPTWSGGGRNVVERERVGMCMESVHCFPLAGPVASYGSWSGPSTPKACGGFVGVWSTEAARRTSALEREVERELPMSVFCFFEPMLIVSDDFFVCSVKSTAVCRSHVGWLSHEFWWGHRLGSQIGGLIGLRLWSLQPLARVSDGGRAMQANYVLCSGAWCGCGDRSRRWQAAAGARACARGRPRISEAERGLKCAPPMPSGMDAPGAGGGANQ